MSGNPYGQQVGPAPFPADLAQDAADPSHEGGHGVQVLPRFAQLEEQGVAKVIQLKPVIVVLAAIGANEIQEVLTDLFLGVVEPGPEGPHDGVGGVVRSGAQQQVGPGHFQGIGEPGSPGVMNVVHPHGGEDLHSGFLGGFQVGSGHPVDFRRRLHGRIPAVLGVL